MLCVFGHQICVLLDNIRYSHGQLLRIVVVHMLINL